MRTDESWVRLAGMKESHPVETAQHAPDSGLLDEPAFESVEKKAATVVQDQIKDKALVKNSQVWHQSAKDCKAGTSD